MAATPEKKVKAKVVEILKAHGAYYFFPATFGMGRSGVPDIVRCYKGMFLAIECKANGNKTTALQDREIEAIKKSVSPIVRVTVAQTPVLSGKRTIGHAVCGVARTLATS